MGKLGRSRALSAECFSTCILNQATGTDLTDIALALSAKILKTPLQFPASIRGKAKRSKSSLYCGGVCYLHDLQHTVH
jgi:hypothetical protein